MKRSHQLLFFILFLTTLALNSMIQLAPQAKSAEQKDDLEIVILVHGIISLKQSLNPQNVAKFVRDRIADTTYARATELTRKDPYFYQYHAMQGLGLRKIDLTTQEKGAASTAFAKALNSIYKEANNTTPKVYYTFGWSGLLSPRMRYLEAKIFYNHMLKEFAQYYHQHKNIKIRIISYSHGGNVALKIAEVYKEEGYPKDKKITIDELVLFGVPVLTETDYLINSSLFKKIYHFYSYGDRVQRLDCFSLNRMLSNRLFRERSDLKLPDKLVQVNIRVKRPVQGKEAILLQERPETAVHRKRLMRTADPGHTELWSFGWAPSSYRKGFPLNPLPISAFIPFFTNSLEQYAQDGKSLFIELHPFLERMIVYDYKAKKETIVPFITKDKISAIKNEMLVYVPDHYTKEIYDARINFAKSRARQQWLAEHNIRRFGHHKRPPYMPECLKELPNL